MSSACRTSAPRGSLSLPPPAVEGFSPTRNGRRHMQADLGGSRGICECFYAARQASRGINLQATTRAHIHASLVLENPKRFAKAARLLFCVQKAVNCMLAFHAKRVQNAPIHAEIIRCAGNGWAGFALGPHCLPVAERQFQALGTADGRPSMPSTPQPISWDSMSRAALTSFFQCPGAFSCRCP